MLASDFDGEVKVDWVVWGIIAVGVLASVAAVAGFAYAIVA